MQDDEGKVAKFHYGPERGREERHELPEKPRYRLRAVRHPRQKRGLAERQKVCLQQVPRVEVCEWRRLRP